MEIKITQCVKIYEVNNNMCHNYYFLAKGRAAQGVVSMPFRFIIWFDIFDICEYYDADKVTAAQIKEYGRILAYDWLENNCDMKNLLVGSARGKFINACNATIKKFNGEI